MLRFVKKFLQLEASSGIALMAAATLALLITNSDYAFYYETFLEWPLGISLADQSFSMSLSHWINDGLMAVFFLMVGLEIKREILEGELSTRANAMLPVVAALGGVVVPALFYVFINWDAEGNMRGWAIPSATDIAFSLGILSLFGKRVPTSLKIFLMALAVIDDLAAVIIIAMFYTDHIAVPALMGSLLCAAVLLGCNRFGVNRPWPYVVGGILLWVMVLKSGVHATIAGVVLGALVPMQPIHRRRFLPERVAAVPLVSRTIHRIQEIMPQPPRQSLGRGMIQGMHPWVAFGVMPIFAFANAGVSFGGLSFSHMMDPLALGIATGLFFGKQIGIVGATWLLVRLRLASLSQGASWLQFYAVSVLAGIGFTMSLFIGELAFGGDLSRVVHMKLGIISGSLLSALWGCAVMALAIRIRTRDHAHSHPYPSHAQS